MIPPKEEEGTEMLCLIEKSENILVKESLITETMETRSKLRRKKSFGTSTLFVWGKCDGQTKIFGRFEANSSREKPEKTASTVIEVGLISI